MKKYILIEHDPLFICQRLKEIDKSYFVLLNKKSGLYEVHSSDQIGDSYCFTVRFDALDDRTLDYARRTRAERQAECIREMDEANEKLQKSLIKSATEKIMEVVA